MIKLDPGDLNNDSFVAGLGNYDGTNLQTIFLFGSKTLWYASYKFDQGTDLELIEIQPGIDNKDHGEAIWVGNNSVVKNGKTLEEAYIAVGSKQHDTNT